MKALAILVGLGGVAAADPSATIYFNGGQKSSGSDGALIVKIDDDAKGTLAAIAGKDKKGAVVCYKAEDKAFLVGCYVAIARDGFVSAPMFDAKKAAKEGEPPFIHPMPSIEGGVAIKAIGAASGGAASGGNSVEIQILGNAGNAIALWANCSKPKQGLLVCGTNSGMAGKLSWEPSFRVTTGGKIVVGK